MIKRMLLLITVSTLLFACSQEEQTTKVEETPKEEVKPKKQRPLAIENNKFYQKGDKSMLYAGKDSSWHFDITNCSLKDSNYHYGIGREMFKALFKPQFMDLTSADTVYPDSARFLLANINGDVRAYGIDLLTNHEVVNDVVGGENVMLAYCILADLGAMYSRDLGSLTYTFGVSGYTYFDKSVWDGMDGFILWDRDTESLWWPLIGEAVSGSMKGTKLKVMDEQYWSQTTWGEIKQNHQEVKVLIPNQTMDAPQNWTKFTPEQVKENLQTIKEGKAIAPKWGENS